MTKHTLLGGTMALAMLMGLSACTDPYDPAQRAVGGGLLGAATGAAIGAAAGGGRGAALGAAIGGGVGAATGVATTPRPPPPPPGYYGGYPPPPDAILTLERFAARTRRARTSGGVGASWRRTE